MNSDDDLPLFAATPKPAPKPQARPEAAARVIAVSELNRRVRNLLEANLELLWISGEISNLVRAASGHWYFSLKDDAAQVRCVMFRQRAQALPFTPENGMQVEVRALPSLYEPRGEFQLGVETMRRAGMGALFEAFERLKARLAAAGLFDEARKKPLPVFPRTIGVVTSLQAAALRDVLTTLKRRAPMLKVIIYPTPVQGASAPAEIAAAIDHARERGEVEVLIICRGGGSIEDLWSFNEEIVARAIVRLQNETTIPVVSGIGHETDFTICDFVADRRAPTPTAAAELVSPDREELLAQAAAIRAQLARIMRRRLDTAQQRIDHAARGLLSPTERLKRERDRLALLAARARHALTGRRDDAAYQITLMRQRLRAQRPSMVDLREMLARRRQALRDAGLRGMQQRQQRLSGLHQALSLLSPDQVLERGYSIVERVQAGGAILRDARDTHEGEPLSVRLARGRIGVVVTKAGSDSRE
ncbi:MAG TPA: exodeoxyribonuclease VII large subunit [Usitatibacteraceae bacterium]